VNRRLAAVIGIAMILCGVAVLVKSFTGGRPVTGQRFLDVAFALFFFVRGAMQLRIARRPPGPGPRV
jgi:uncharacterized membrane protein HdeD (DUF308 family)